MVRPSKLLSSFTSSPSSRRHAPSRDREVRPQRSAKLRTPAALARSRDLVQPLGESWTTAADDHALAGMSQLVYGYSGASSFLDRHRAFTSRTRASHVRCARRRGSAMSPPATRGPFAARLRPLLSGPARSRVGSTGSGLVSLQAFARLVPCQRVEDALERQVPRTVSEELQARGREPLGREAATRPSLLRARASSPRA
jgi:hypothetical protein